jgi:hypothetical protein
MHYVILRDDDTNALTPVECLDRLYRPFLERGFPVNLATIPNVSTRAEYAAGCPELFLMEKKRPLPPNLPIGSNSKLVKYLKSDPHYRIVQHGCRHDSVQGHHEFDHEDRPDLAARLDEGIRLLVEAGFPRPSTFVAPYDKLSRAALEEAGRRFPVVSTGWYELNRLPLRWWPHYAGKKILRTSHWRAGNTLFLSHPGCHLSYHRPYATMLDDIIRSIRSRRLTVLVTHWWEYFRNHRPDDTFISVLHRTASWMASQPNVRVISFDELMREDIEPG